MELHYAIGDVHGRDDLLEALHERIVADRAYRHSGARATLVYLGDYIDRGANSLRVIDRVMQGLPGFDTVYLKGNHEELMLDCMQTDDRETWSVWVTNGGRETLESFGLRFRYNDYDPLALAKALGPERLAWLDKLRLYHRADPYLFVHAGMVPGRPLAQQQAKDMLWIRRAFLDSEADHGFIVVHGHTPREQAELKRNRINVDTGATFHGRLTAVALGEDEGPRFLTIEGAPGRGDA